MPRPFSFCLCADDYAMTPGITRGILEAIDARAVTATSVMTNSPWWPESAGKLQRQADRIGVGLHINLTVGPPLGPMPTFAPNGRFPEMRQVMDWIRRKALPLDEIAAEIGRQCDQFTAILQRPPDHVDGHQHVHVLRPIRPLVFAALNQRAWQPWLRDSTDHLYRLACRAGRKKALALRILGRGFHKNAAGSGLATNRGFAGFSSFDPAQSFGQLFETYLRAPGSCHLVMCHPGYADDALRRLDTVVETREQELKFLTTDLFTLLNRKEARLGRIISGRDKIPTVRELDIHLNPI